MTANPKERYDAIIIEIEKLIRENDFPDAKEIAMKVIKRQTIDARQLGSLFQFMTNQPPISYIKGRMLMRAAECLLSNKADFDVQRAIDMAGCSDQSSFNHLFQKKFSTTPKQAWRDPSSIRIETPKTWDIVSSPDCQEQLLVDYSEEPVPNTRFGISLEEYKTIMRTTDLQALYGFNSTVAEIAFRCSKNFGISIEKSFAYISAFDWSQPEEFAEIEKRYGDQEKVIHAYVKYIQSTDLQYLFFECGVRGSLEICQEKLKREGVEDVTHEPSELVREWLGCGFEVRYEFFSRAYKAFRNRFPSNEIGEKKWNYFLDSIGAGSSIYHALEFADNFFDDDEFEDMSGWGVEPDYTEEDAAWDADLRYYHDIEESWGDECPEIEY